MEAGRYYVEAVLVEGRSVSEVARTHGVSRRWIQKCLARYREEGEVGLEPRSKRPKHSPGATAIDVEDEIVLLRKQLDELGLDAGPHTIAHHIAGRVERVPSVATIGRILTRRGFITPQPKKRPKSSYIRFVADLPNEMWQSDFTHWQLADGTEVEVLNFLDDHSRLALSSWVYPRVKAVNVFEQFRRTATEFGVPASMLTDNGRVYRTSQYGAKVLIETELERLGVTFKHGKPYHPQTQGKIERWHQTLKKYLAKQPTAETIAELQSQIDAFVKYYNNVRPSHGVRKLSRDVARSPLLTARATHL